MDATKVIRVALPHSDERGTSNECRFDGYSSDEIRALKKRYESGDFNELLFGPQLYRVEDFTMAGFKLRWV